MPNRTKSPSVQSESTKNSSNESKNNSQKLITSLLILIIAILIGFIFQQQLQMKPGVLETNKDLLYEELKKELRREILEEVAKKEFKVEKDKKVQDDPKIVENVVMEKPKVENKIVEKVEKDKKVQDDPKIVENVVMEKPKVENKIVEKVEKDKKVQDEPKIVENVSMEKPKVEDKIVIEDKKLEDLTSAEINFQNGKTISLDSKKIKIKAEEPKKEEEKQQNQESDKILVPKEVENFPQVKISKMKTKKMWIPIPNSNGGHRRVPPIEIKFGKEHGSSVKVWLFEEFLSQEESEHLIKAHESHLKELLKQKPIICFDSISTLKKNLIELKREPVAQTITPNDFTTGTNCLNQTFSRKLEKWGLKWSFSTAFYPGESKFSRVFGKRIEEATMLNETHGGKFQITSYPSGVGYKDHTDCIVNSEDQRDRYATFLVYLNELGADGGGETIFPELGIDVKPRQGRALTWNNMNYETGKCEAKSVHRASPVQHQVKKKYIIQRWYYFKNFYALGKRMAEAPLPEREPNTPKVSCDNYDNGSCRMYDEWNPDHMIDYQREKKIY
ncbi:putative prolyl 4-hydroxylase 10 [Brachionus plicatilis]|uniref:Putative prolyl 4-hydroxylase 10 n=1 Tax=Brachionus plicatilis TaxID=10195 RepID=A0A3M7R5T5_BRAPC|nr:putative prolyl 4-hydroxylase 10 [Brachionus plicatilis]